MKNLQFSSKWWWFLIMVKLLYQYTPYSPVTKSCNLCLSEMYNIMFNPNLAISNSRNKISGHYNVQEMLVGNPAHWYSRDSFGVNLSEELATCPGNFEQQKYIIYSFLEVIVKCAKTCKISNLEVMKCGIIYFIEQIKLNFDFQWIHNLQFSLD